MSSVSKVEINTPNGKETLIDLTGDGVTPEKLAEGVTAHDASGMEIEGTATFLTDKDLEEIKNDVTPVKGIDYFDGDKGDKGDTGAKGEKGDAGEHGVGIVGIELVDDNGESTSPSANIIGASIEELQ